MSFTTVTLEGTYETQTGSPAEGTVTFTLTQAMSNNGSVIPPIPVVVTLGEHGYFSVELLANDDEGTSPAGVCYGVTETIMGAQPRDYFIALSHAISPVNIAELMPGEPGWE